MTCSHPALAPSAAGVKTLLSSLSAARCAQRVRAPSGHHHAHLQATPDNEANAHACPLYRRCLHRRVHRRRRRRTRPHVPPPATVSFTPPSPLNLVVSPARRPHPAPPPCSVALVTAQRSVRTSCALTRPYAWCTGLSAYMRPSPPPLHRRLSTEELMLIAPPPHSLSVSRTPRRRYRPPYVACTR